ncbi:interferon regulatory factor 2-like isoform X4 [Centruroides sculpturatus]|uniref:interferon regulatory factor 2-like isoform X4 n=1 Tax=Centruroides sculpturatus TaxID=218467 RepID=UPI000C6CE9FD|nr:interferon regulatory factor 2-like isoform X4 [Centruroides sculpturatus]
MPPPILRIMKMNRPIRRRQIRRKKKGICQFLYEKLEDETFDLAQWTDKDKGEFRLHWLHASSGSWTRETDSELFRLWALHKGRLADMDKYKTLKANFRCAMKSRYELEEIKELPNSRRKDLKFWRFTDFSFVKQQQTTADPGQKENRDDNDHAHRSEIKKASRNVRMEKFSALNTEPSRLTPEDNFTPPLNEEPEITYFMDILGQDRSAQEELMHFRSPYYGDPHPVSVQEPDFDSTSDLDLLVTNQIMSHQMDTLERAVAYEYKEPVEPFYSDCILKRGGASVP